MILCPPSPPPSLSPPEGVVGVVPGYVEMFSSSDIMCELYSDQVEVRHRSDLSSHKWYKQSVCSLHGKEKESDIQLVQCIHVTSDHSQVYLEEVMNYSYTAMLSHWHTCFLQWLVSRHPRRAAIPTLSSVECVSRCSPCLGKKKESHKEEIRDNRDSWHLCWS